MSCVNELTKLWYWVHMITVDLPVHWKLIIDSSTPEYFLPFCFTIESRVLQYESRSINNSTPYYGKISSVCCARWCNNECCKNRYLVVLGIFFYLCAYIRRVLQRTGVMGRQSETMTAFGRRATAETVKYHQKVDLFERKDKNATWRTTDGSSTMRRELRSNTTKYQHLWADGRNYFALSQKDYLDVTLDRSTTLSHMQSRCANHWPTRWWNFGYATPQIAVGIPHDEYLSNL